MKDEYRTIFKHKLIIADVQYLHVYSEFVPISVQCQRGDLVLWARCNTAYELCEYRRIHIYGTGNPIDIEPGTYIGTVQMENGLVWHVFDAGPAREYGE